MLTLCFVLVLIFGFSVDKMALLCLFFSFSGFQVVNLGFGLVCINVVVAFNEWFWLHLYFLTLGLAMYGYGFFSKFWLWGFQPILTLFPLGFGNGEFRGGLWGGPKYSSFYSSPCRVEEDFLDYLDLMHFLLFSFPSWFARS